MIKKNNFFKNYSNQSIAYKKNLAKTKKLFNSLKEDIYQNKIEVLETFEKKYNYDFSEDTIKKFSNYKNIILIGMGGSILGAKSIYFFLKKKVKKKYSFLTI